MHNIVLLDRIGTHSFTTKVCLIYLKAFQTRSILGLLFLELEATGGPLSSTWPKHTLLRLCHSSSSRHTTTLTVISNKLRNMTSCGRKGNTREHVACFLDSMGPFANNTELYLREFLKFLMDRAYTWYPISSQDRFRIGITWCLVSRTNSSA